ncbi:MAG: NUDIX hydrolase [Planctomycetota bacterium]|jgi:8-oxo-dGTP pyrophosphatase MutT (NUDIX family)
MNRQLPQLLKRRLEKPLPGPMVGSRFEPRPRPLRNYDRFPPDARQAAVLILLYPHQGRWQVPLTVRPMHLPDHAGQVSLPGGAIEPGETSREAAIREFHEELGAAGHAIDLLGRLSPVYVAASNFRVEPWIGSADSRPPLVPNPDEVERLLEMPLEHLVDPASFGSHLRKENGRPYTAPHFVWQEHRIWGATCMILGELVTLIGELEPVG